MSLYSTFTSQLYHIYYDLMKFDLSVTLERGLFLTNAFFLVNFASLETKNAKVTEVEELLFFVVIKENLCLSIVKSNAN